MKKGITTAVRTVIGVGLLFFLIKAVGLSTIIAALKQLKVTALAVAIFLWVVGYLLGAVNIQLMFRPIKRSIPFRKTLKYYTFSWVSGMLTPARLGQLLLVFFLKKEGFKNGQAIVIQVIDRAITLLVVMLLSYLGLFLFFTKEQAVPIVILSAVLFISGCAILTGEPTRRILKRYILRRHATAFRGFSEALKAYTKAYPILVLNFVITITKTTMNALFIAVLFLGLNTRVNVIDIIVLYAVVTIISLLPLSINGLGLKEASAVYLFSMIGVDKGIAASTFILATVINYMCTAAFYFYFISRKKESGQSNKVVSNS